MSALGSGDHAVGTYDYITVEVYINLKGCQDHEVKLVDVSTLVERICILGCGDLDVVRIGLDGLNGTHIEILGIYDLVDETLRKQVAHRSSDTTEAKSHLNAALLHDLSERDGGCDGRTADTGLIGEAILEVWGVDNELGAVICHHDLTDIGGRFCCAGCDLGRISDLIYDTDEIHLGHGDACRDVRERYEAVSDCYDSVCVPGVYHGIG